MPNWVRITSLFPNHVAMWVDDNTFLVCLHDCATTVIMCVDYF